MSKDNRKRISLLVPPENADGIVELAQIYNCAVNDIINKLIAQCVKQNSDAIKQHRKFKLDAQKKFPIKLAQNLGSALNE